MTKFLIVDGNSIGCRAAFAIPKDHPDLKTKEGIETGTITRFMNMFNKIMMQIKPTHIAVVWDSAEETFRKKLYPEYKANRHKNDKEPIIDMNIVHKQFRMIRKILDLLGIISINIPGYEGDDLCGSLANISEADETYIVTGDKDSFQLIDKDTYVIFPKNGFTDFDIANLQYIEDKFGITVDQYIGLKALQGDQSDNILGYVGCGPKTASKMLNEFGDSDIIAKLKQEDLSHYNKKIRANLEDWQNRYDLIKQLVTIKTDVELSYRYEDFEIELLKWDDALSYFQDLEMYHFINRIHWKAVYRLTY